MGQMPPLEVLRISTVVDQYHKKPMFSPLEVLRISTVVDRNFSIVYLHPLEVLRISTVVDASRVPTHPPLWKY